MIEEKFSDRLKKVNGCIWWLFGALGVVCLFLIMGGILILLVSEETIGGIACIVIGGLSLMLFLGVGILLPYVQWKKGITPESNLQWPSGILTDKIIKRDINKQQKTTVISLFGITALVLVLIVPIILTSGEITTLSLMSLLCAGFTFCWAVKELIVMLTAVSYYIEEDKITDAGIEKSFDIIDAATNHMPTHTPKFLFEKHGVYDIYCVQIHSYYPPETLVQIMEIGEEVYLVKSNKTNEILHIYRKKYWTR